MLEEVPEKTEYNKILNDAREQRQLFYQYRMVHLLNCAEIFKTNVPFCMQLDLEYKYIMDTRVVK